MPEGIENRGKAMRVLQVNNVDLEGEIYNGRKLSSSLSQKGIMSWQMVMQKSGTDASVLPIITPRELQVRYELRKLEQRLGLTSLLQPFTENIVNSMAFRKADIVHYHLIHNQLISMLDFAPMVNMKPSVWSLHDPWLVTGHCTHPVECNKWKNGCQECSNLNDLYFPMQIDKAKDLWKIKRDVYKQINQIDIVVATDWMRHYVENSPLTAHFNRIHTIPFGLEISKYKGKDKEKIRKILEIPHENCVIMFRYSEFSLKGVQYILETLRNLEVEEPVTLLTVGGTGMSDECLKRKFQIIELGMQREEGVIDAMTAADIFLMPSIAESFGLMAIEAMAAKCAVVVFESTVLEQITFAPKCGVAVKYKDSSDMEQTVKRLILNDSERKWRGEEGQRIVEENYIYNDYVKKHIALYEELSQRTGERKSIFEGILLKSEEQEMRLEEGMQKIHDFHKQLESLIPENAEDICIFGAGVYGKLTYRALKERIVNVKYVIDNDRDKWGWSYIKQNWPSSFNDIQCVGMEQLKRGEKEPLIIVANKNPDGLVKDLKAEGFHYIITKQTLDIMLKNVPGLSELNDMANIEALDYSSEGVRELIRQFNRTIADICSYYEKR